MMEVRDMHTDEAETISRHLMLKEYGANLLQRRKERGITRIELFERTGVSVSDISKAERGLLELSEEQKLRISKFLRRQRII